MSRSRYVTGLRAVEELLAAGSTEIQQIFAEYQTANPRVQAVIDAARRAGIEIQAANRARLTQISGESRHQGIVAEVRRTTVLDEGALRTLVEERLQQDRDILLLVLDGLQDPHNLGACMRTADAVGVDAVVVPRHGAAGLGPAVSKVASGAAEQLPFAQVGNVSRVLGWLGDYGVRCVGTSDKASKTLFEADLTGSVAIVMGREHSGLGKSLAARCDDLISIPMKGVVSSLNVSVATGVCLYEILRQRSAAAPSGP